MNLHEYQAKQLFKQFQCPVPQGFVANSLEEVAEIAKKLPLDRWVVKAQVHAGGRGKAGGVKLVKGKDELTSSVQSLLGKRLVTYQTDANGQPVNSVLIEEVSDIDKELYLGAVLDRSTKRVVFMASTEGGVEIEKVAEETPEKIHKMIISPLVGAMPFQGRELAFRLGLVGDQINQFVQIYLGLAKLFQQCDLSLLEVNPLIITKAGNLVCLDGKINIDDNALYRQPELNQMRDPSQEDPKVNRAHEWELNYVPLDGEIGCMVNGAGLAMATMDVVALHGAKPANFLDVGGTATKERVTEAFKIITSDPHVKGILVNIFGGIVRCDLIADGIISAVAEVGIKVPVVVRLEGTNSDLGTKKLKESGLNIIPASDLSSAAEKIVAAVAGEKA